MYETNYHRPKDVAEAAKLFAGASEARYLAGGQTLLPTMKQRLAAPSDVIDLRKLPELKGIKVTADAVTIGAATTAAGGVDLTHLDFASWAAAIGVGLTAFGGVFVTPNKPHDEISAADQIINNIPIVVQNASEADMTDMTFTLGQGDLKRAEALMPGICDSSS